MYGGNIVIKGTLNHIPSPLYTSVRTSCIFMMCHSHSWRFICMFVLLIMLPSFTSEQQPLRLNPAEISEVIAEVCSEATSNASQSIAPSRLSTQSRQPSADVAFSVLIKLVIDMYNSITHFFLVIYSPISNLANFLDILITLGIVVMYSLFTSFTTDIMAWST